jgi:paraquat-inducible protein B
VKKAMQKGLQQFKTGWYIWLFPVVALLISSWLLYDYSRQQGPRIRISFDDAASIQVEKTKVRFRGVAIGTVKDITISEDQRSVVAEVLLRKDAEQFAVEGSKFSLVTPKVGFQGISGLETLFEGTYIALLPGPTEAKAKYDFKAQANSATDTLDDTSSYMVETESAESIGPGASVSFRGVKVGTVTKLHFLKGSQMVAIQLNLDNKYVKLVRTNTIFWRKVGIQAKLGIFGSDIKVNSMDSIMNGGIEFATPSQAGPVAKSQQKFTLAPIAPKDLAKWNPFLD